MLLQQSDFGAVHQAILCLHVNMPGLHNDSVWSSERPPVNGGSWQERLVLCLLSMARSDMRAPSPQLALLCHSATRHPWTSVKGL